MQFIAPTGRDQIFKNDGGLFGRLDEIPFPGKQVVSHRSISSFRRKAVTIELRYESAYLIWDRAGLMWTEIHKRFKKNKSHIIQPNQVLFVSDDRYSMDIGLEKMAITDSLSIKPEETANVVGECAYVALQILEVKSLNRIGTRIQLSWPQADEVSMNRAMCELSLTALPPGKLFGITPSSVAPTYKIEVNDGELGYTAMVYPIKRRTQIDPVLQAVEDITPFDKTHFEIVLDVDFYTMAPVPAEGFNAAAWLERWLRVSARDMEGVLNLATAQ